MKFIINYGWAMYLGANGIVAGGVRRFIIFPPITLLFARSLCEFCLDQYKREFLLVNPEEVFTAGFVKNLNKLFMESDNKRVEADAKDRTAHP